MATANGSQRVLRPEGTLPTVPDGFWVASYAELRGPRMMVYAPNGDLFVSSPTTNSIWVLRDTDNDGVFEARGVFADGETAPPPAPTPAAGGGRPAPPLGSTRRPAVACAQPPACTPPPDYVRRGPGGLRLPFGSRLPRWLSVRRQYGLARPIRVPGRRPGGAGRAGEAARLADRRPPEPQHRVQSRRNQGVYRGGSASNSGRRRRLPPRRDPGGETPTARALGSTRRASAIPWDWHCSRGPTWCGPPRTNATTSATIWCRTT